MGRARRQRRRRARVDPPPSQARADRATRPRSQGTNAVALPVLAVDADDDRGAPAGAAARGPRQEAVRAARAHRRGRDDRVVLRQRVRHAGRVPLHARPRRARPDRQAPSSASIDRLAEALRALLCARCCRTGVFIVLCSVVLVVASGWVAARLPSHVLPRDRRVDGARLRAARAGHVARRSRPRKIKEMGETLRKELPPGNVKLVLTNVGSPKATRARR